METVLKRTVKISKVVEQEVEVKLPYFSKSSATDLHYYKVTGSGQRDCIQVTFSENNASTNISIGYSDHAFNTDNNIECNEDEFNSAYEGAEKYLRSKL